MSSINLKLLTQSLQIALWSVALMCGVSPPKSTDISADEQAKEFKAEPSRARVYIFDHHAPINIQNIAVVVETQIVGHLGKKRFMVLDLPAGKHVFTSVGGQDNPEFELSVAVGRVYFLQQRQLVGLDRLGGAAYSEVPAEVGMREVRKRVRVPARYVSH